MSLNLFIRDVEGERRIEAERLPLRVGTGSDCELRLPGPGGGPVMMLDLLDDVVSHVFAPGRPVLDAIAALSHEIFEHFTFDPSATDWASPLDTVLELRRGVCQDFAHLALAVFRRRVGRRWESSATRNIVRS